MGLREVGAGAGLSTTLLQLRSQLAPSKAKRRISWAFIMYRTRIGTDDLGGLI